MKAILVMVLILGVGLAGFAVFMVKGYVSDTENALVAEKARSAQIVETVDVVAVNKPRIFGDTLTVADVKIVRYAREFLPEGAFPTIDALFSDGTDLTRSVLRPMEANEIVLATSVTLQGQIASITQEVRPLMRAFTIRVDAATGVSGFLRPGNRVDVYWTGTVGPGNNQAETHLIGSSIELVAIDQSTDKNRIETSVPNTVTVQVSVDDVARLAQAQSEGTLSLSLVGAHSEAAIVADGAQAITLPRLPELAELSPTPTPVLSSAAPAACFTAVRRGLEKAQVQIPCTQ